MPEAGTYKSWQFICNDLQSLTDYNNATLQAFFERHFMPYEASAAGQTKGLFTGYYEAGLRGSRTKHGPYIYPLYTRPDDLVMVDLGEFREELKGQRIAGRVNDVKQLKPYEDRAAIVAGNWPHNDKVLVWVDDPVDAFFLHIQGSGRVRMPDGSMMRIGSIGEDFAFESLPGDIFQLGNQSYKVQKVEVNRVLVEDARGAPPTIPFWFGEAPARSDELSAAVSRLRESAMEKLAGGVTVTPAVTVGRSVMVAATFPIATGL